MWWVLILGDQPPLATTYDSKGKTNFYRGGVVKQKRGVFKAIRKSLQEKQTSSARHRLKADWESRKPLYD